MGAATRRRGTRQGGGRRQRGGGGAGAAAAAAGLDGPMATRQLMQIAMVMGAMRQPVGAATFAQAWDWACDQFAVAVNAAAVVPYHPFTRLALAYGIRLSPLHQPASRMAQQQQQGSGGEVRTLSLALKHDVDGGATSDFVAAVIAAPPEAVTIPAQHAPAFAYFLLLHMCMWAPFALAFGRHVQDFGAAHEFLSLADGDQEAFYEAYYDAFGLFWEADDPGPEG